MSGYATVFTSLGSGTCCCHSDPTCISTMGMIITGSSDHTIEGQGAARVTDIFLGFCGHTAIMITGSSKSQSNGLGACIVGSMFTGCINGSIITGTNKTSTT